VTGESPAILTETVWALAHETPALIPSRVVVVTTTTGAARLQTELRSPLAHFSGRSAWQALRDELLAGRPDAERLLVLEQTHVITGPAGADGCARPLDDLRTRADNAAAADFILDAARRITANPDTLLVASIAGGRKTMGALLYAALTLVGRETDRLTHVLVNSPFDQRLDPPFFFPPAKPVRHTFSPRAGKPAIHSSATAVIELAEVPFVPLRNGFEELKRPAGSFAGLVARYSRELRALAEPPVISFDDARHAVLFDGRPVVMENEMQIAILRILFGHHERLAALRPSFTQCAELVRAAVSGQFSIAGNDARAAAAFASELRPKAPATPLWLKEFGAHAITRTLSELRKRVRPICPHWIMPPRGLILPPFRLG
jgi:CRISPR-associated protein (TIGR02584 family)